MKEKLNRAKQDTANTLKIGIENVVFRTFIGPKIVSGVITDIGSDNSESLSLNVKILTERGEQKDFTLPQQTTYTGTQGFDPSEEGVAVGRRLEIRKRGESLVVILKGKLKPDGPKT